MINLQLRKTKELPVFNERLSNQLSRQRAKNPGNLREILEWDDE